MKYADLKTLLDAGKRLTIQFTQDIEESESYAEPNMRARAIAMTKPDSDGTIKVTLDFEPFDAHNRTLESSNYYDREHNPVLTARQAGLYQPNQNYWFLADENLPFNPIAENPAWEAYQKETRTVSYLEWLEAEYVKANPPSQADHLHTLLCELRDA